MNNPTAAVHAGRLQPVGRRQRGAALIFALLALIALSLASVALVRSIDSGTLVIGNLGFKQDATAAGDQAVEQALVWMASAANGHLHQDHSNEGYYASALDSLDPTGESLVGNASRALVDWNDDGCSYANGTYSACLTPSAEITANGTSSRYIVARLCSTAGNPASTGMDCPGALAGGNIKDSAAKGSIDYENSARFKSNNGDSAYYRIVVRTEGGRKTVSYTETVVYY